MDSNRNQIDEIKDRLDIVQVVEKYVRLKKAGKNYSGLCPFHTEKTASFIVSPDLQRYKCFGCGETGDIFNFIQKIENLDFPEALEKLAKEAGITLQKREVNYKYKTLEEINYIAAKYFYNELKKNKQALNYLLVDRGLTKESIKNFGLGFAPKEPNLRRFLSKEKIFSTSDLVKSGVFNKNERGIKEKFSNRVMFPIRSKRGRVIAFNGRLLPGNKWGPKYLNSPDTPIFHKGENLFGQYESRQEIRKKDLAIICEGSTDVISAHQFGIKNTVAPLGTGLTKEQLESLSLLTKNVLFLFDNDKAGQDALIRGFKIASELKLNPYAATPQPYKDVDELLQKEPKKINQIIANKKEAFSLIISTAIENRDLSKLEEITYIKNYISPLLESVKDDSTKQLYIRKVEKILKLKPNHSFETEPSSKTNCYKPHRNEQPYSLRYVNFVKYLLLLDDKNIVELPSPKYITDKQISKIYNIILANKDTKRETLYEKIKENEEIRPLFEDIIFNLTDIPKTQEEIKGEILMLAKKIKEDYYKDKQKNLSIKIAIAEENNDNEKSEKYLKELMKINKLLKEVK